MKFPVVSASASGGSAREFVKLKDGESIKGVFLGEPFIYRQHWLEGRSQVCTASACGSCAEGEKPTFRFRLNFAVEDQGAWGVKILEQGWGFFNDLRALNDEYPLEKHVIKITRMGTGTDTRYQLMPAANSLLSGATLATVARLTLHELDPLKIEAAAKAEAHAAPVQAAPVRQDEEYPFGDFDVAMTAAPTPAPVNQSAMCPSGCGPMIPSRFNPNSVVCPRCKAQRPRVA